MTYLPNWGINVYCICVYMYICTYLYICIYIYMLCIFMNLYTREDRPEYNLPSELRYKCILYKCICVYMYMCIYIYIYMCCVYLWICIRGRTDQNMTYLPNWGINVYCINVYVYMCICMYIYIYIYIYLYIYMYCVYLWICIRGRTDQNMTNPLN
jgi:hypothetical protein